MTTLPYDDEPLGVIPTLQLLRELGEVSSTAVSTFLEEFVFLVEDDIAEMHRQQTLRMSSPEKKKQQHQPLARYMTVPLSFVRNHLAKSPRDEDLHRYFVESRGGDDDEEEREGVEPRLAALIGKAAFAPLQIVYRLPLKTTTAAAREATRRKNQVARAHQEREAYNRMLKGSTTTTATATTAASSSSPTSMKSRNNSGAVQHAAFPGGVDPSSLHLKATSGGVGFLAQDAFSSSSRHEMETVIPPPKNFIQRISRDIGMGLDVPLMAAAGAVVGWYACSLRGMSQNESAIGAAVCATVFFIVDGILVLMRVAREDLGSSAEKRHGAAVLEEATKQQQQHQQQHVVDSSSPTATAAASAKKNKKKNGGRATNAQIVKREVLGARDDDDDEDKKTK